jgi:hypothetical protein
VGGWEDGGDRNDEECPHLLVGVTKGGHIAIGFGIVESDKELDRIRTRRTEAARYLS